MTTALAPLRPHGQWTAPPPPGFSSRRPLLLGFLTLSVLAAGLFGWGAFASISGAVIASGRVEVGTGDQVVEHIDGGTVGEILVRDGARVSTGEVLIRLEDAALRTEETILRGEQVELAARRNRLEAEFRGADAIAWDADLAALVQGDASVREVLEGQQRLFEARHSSWAGQEAMLRFSAFPARTTPEYAGRVARVSADARHDERTGLSWYEVELALGEAIEPDAGTGIGAWPGRAARTAAGWLPAGAGAWLRRNAPDPVGGWLGERPPARPGAEATPGHALDLALTPGMPVEVHVRTGERSPLSYLAKPLTDYFSRSLREE